MKRGYNGVDGVSVTCDEVQKLEDYRRRIIWVAQNDRRLVRLLDEIVELLTTYVTKHDELQRNHRLFHLQCYREVADYLDNFDTQVVWGYRILSPESARRLRTLHWMFVQNQLLLAAHRSSDPFKICLAIQQYPTSSAAGGSLQPTHFDVYHYALGHNVLWASDHPASAKRKLVLCEFIRQHCLAPIQCSSDYEFIAEGMLFRTWWLMAVDSSAKADVVQRFKRLVVPPPLFDCRRFGWTIGRNAMHHMTKIITGETFSGYALMDVLDHEISLPAEKLINDDNINMLVAKHWKQTEVPRLNLDVDVIVIDGDEGDVHMESPQDDIAPTAGDPEPVALPYEDDDVVIVGVYQATMQPVDVVERTEHPEPVAAESPQDDIAPTAGDPEPVAGPWPDDDVVIVGVYQATMQPVDVVERTEHPEPVAATSQYKDMPPLVWRDETLPPVARMSRVPVAGTSGNEHMEATALLGPKHRDETLQPVANTRPQKGIEATALSGPNRRDQTLQPVVSAIRQPVASAIQPNRADETLQPVANTRPQKGMEASALSGPNRRDQTLQPVVRAIRQPVASAIQPNRADETLQPVANTRPQKGMEATALSGPNRRDETLQPVVSAIRQPVASAIQPNRADETLQPVANTRPQKGMEATALSGPNRRDQTLQPVVSAIRQPVASAIQPNRADETLQPVANTRPQKGMEATALSGPNRRDQTLQPVVSAIRQPVASAIQPNRADETLQPVANTRPQKGMEATALSGPNRRDQTLQPVVSAIRQPVASAIQPNRADETLQPVANTRPQKGMEATALSGPNRRDQTLQPVVSAIRQPVASAIQPNRADETLQPVANTRPQKGMEATALSGPNRRDQTLQPVVSAIRQPVASAIQPNRADETLQPVANTRPQKGMEATALSGPNRRDQTLQPVVSAIRQPVASAIQPNRADETLQPVANTRPQKGMDAAALSGPNRADETLQPVASTIRNEDKEATGRCRCPEHIDETLRLEASAIRQPVASAINEPMASAIREPVASASARASAVSLDRRDETLQPVASTSRNEDNRRYENLQPVASASTAPVASTNRNEDKEATALASASAGASAVSPNRRDETLQPVASTSRNKDNRRDEILQPVASASTAPVASTSRNEDKEASVGCRCPIHIDETLRLEAIAMREPVANASARASVVSPNRRDDTLQPVASASRNEDNRRDETLQPVASTSRNEDNRRDETLQPVARASRNEDNRRDETLQPVASTSRNEDNRRDETLQPVARASRNEDNRRDETLCRCPKHIEETLRLEARASGEPVASARRQPVARTSRARVPRTRTISEPVFITRSEPVASTSRHEVLETAIPLPPSRSTEDELQPVATISRMVPNPDAPNQTIQSPLVAISMPDNLGFMNDLMHWWNESKDVHAYLDSEFKTMRVVQYLDHKINEPDDGETPHENGPPIVDDPIPELCIVTAIAEQYAIDSTRPPILNAINAEYLLQVYKKENAYLEYALRISPERAEELLRCHHEFWHRLMVVTPPQEFTIMVRHNFEQKLLKNEEPSMKRRYVLNAASLKRIFDGIL